MTDTCLTTLPYTIRFIKTTWLLGCVLSSTCYGLLVSLVWLSLDSLRKRERGNPRVNRMLIGFVLLTIVVGTIAEVWDVKVTVDAVFNDSCHSDYLRPPNPYYGHIDIVFLIINLLTDGLLVWRCYMVANGLQGKAWTVLWLIPLIVYIGMVVTGIVLTITSWTPRTHHLGRILILIQFGISLFLNTIITSSLVTLLLRQRNEFVRAFGKGQGQSTPYLNISTMLIESAGLILIVDVFALATISFVPFGNIAFQLWVHAQPIASVLIIYRVSRGVDYFSREGNAVNNGSSSGVLSSHPFSDMSNSGGGSIVFATPSSS